jgi:phosphotransferase system, enzyme I, PtsP
VARKKDNVSLVCDIGELAGLFERTKTIEDFLKTAVSIVAYHMHAAVCSVYLYDEVAQELVLKANQGLHDAEGHVRLKLGEGLVGRSMQELRPIRESNAQRSPFFRLVPGINEERYTAFLAVPILRGITRVGVLVVQDPVEDYFDSNDTKALQAIAAQLATTIENFNLILSIRQGKESTAPQASDADVPRFLKGSAASPGCAIGKALFLDREEKEEPAGGDTQTAVLDFQQSLRTTEHQLAGFQRHMEEEFTDVASMIFSAHLLILKDDMFSGQMAALINAGSAPRAAIHTVVRDYISRFSASRNPRLREKVNDVKDLGRRLLRNLGGATEEADDYKGRIIIASEVLPSEIVKLAAQRAEGLVVVGGGGVTAHVSVLARSLQLPMIVVDDARLLAVRPGCEVLLDGDQGNLLIAPGAEVTRSFEALAAHRRAAEDFIAPDAAGALTLDGQRVAVRANINILNEVGVAARMNASGIGLYRSEFPFIIRSNFPSEEEQFRIYRKIIESMPGRPIIFRTLDVGGDKALSYFPAASEANPFLGLRALRFSLRNKGIFSEQLRALLRAGASAELCIMFPLVSSVDDFLEARAVVGRCIEELRAENVNHNPSPKIGAMIELPSAVAVVEELAAECDFLSIGSNDLVQYILAVDRTNEHISDLYLTHHPAVLRALNRIALAARAYDKPLSFCGEMACDPRMLPFLLGIGIRTVSVEVRQIPRLHKLISQIDTTAAAAAAQHLLSLGLIRDIEAALAPVQVNS